MKQIELRCSLLVVDDDDDRFASLLVVAAIRLEISKQKLFEFRKKFVVKIDEIFVHKRLPKMAQSFMSISG